MLVVVIVSELVALIVIVGAQGFATGFAEDLAVLSAYTQWCGLSAAAALCLSRKLLNGLNELAIVGLSLVLILAVVYIVAELAWWVVSPVVGADAWFDLSRGELIVRTILIAGVVGAVLLRYFYVQFHWQQRIASEAGARLEALQARIRPHFFFNCMNSIASLTRSDPPLAERAVEDLADLFRASLADAKALVPLTEEFEFVRRYLSIEQLRLGERLKVCWYTDDTASSARIPLLSLQPIVENAIYHGIEPALEGGEVTIKTTAIGNRLQIAVSNPVADASNTHHEGNQLALENIRQRLRAHFGEQATLRHAIDGGVYRVELLVPITEDSAV